MSREKMPISYTDAALEVAAQLQTVTDTLIAMDEKYSAISSRSAGELAEIARRFAEQLKLLKRFAMAAAAQSLLILIILIAAVATR